MAALSFGRLANPLARFSSLRVTTQFFLAGSVLVVVATALIGQVLTRIVEHDALEARGSATALFVDAVAGPLVQDLAAQDLLSGSAVTALDRLFEKEAFRARFPFLEIWHPEGRIVYSNSAGLAGQVIALPAGAQAAMQGEVVTAITDLGAREHSIRNWTEPYLEIYLPLRELGSGRIIAVAEIHEESEDANRILWQLRTLTWALVLGGGALFLAGLYGIVARAARQIDRQERKLYEQITQLRTVSEHNASLSERIRSASRKLSEMNENVIRRIGSELHDGPAQMIAFAMLNTEQIRRERDARRRARIIDRQEDALKEAQGVIRTLAQGLLLPDVMDTPLPRLIGRAVAIHEARTGSTVEVTIDEPVPETSPAIRICILRFVQEGLTNAYRHGVGARHALTLARFADGLQVSIRNDVDEAPRCARQSEEAGLGLVGMRYRVEGLGGSFSFAIGNGVACTRLEFENVAQS